MRRLVAVCAFTLGLLASGSARAADETVRTAIGFTNVAPEVVFAHLRQLHSSGGRVVEGLAAAPAARSSDAYAAVSTETNAYSAGTFAPNNALRVWATPHVFSAVHTGDAGYSNDTVGWMLGADKSVGAFTFGLALEYACGDYDARDHYYKNDFDAFNGTVFGRFTCGNWSLEADFGYGRFWGDARRDAAVHATSEPDMSAWYAGLAAAYRFWLGADWVLTPSLAIQYVYVKEPGYQENHGGFHFGKTSHNYVRTPLALTVERPVRLFGKTVTPYGRLGVTPEWHHDLSKRDVSAPGYHENVHGPKAIRWIGTAGLGVNAKFGMRTDVNVGWDIELGNRYRNNIFNAGVGLAF